MNKVRYYSETYSFLLPSLIVTLVFAVYPIIWAMRYMVYDYPGYGNEVFTGFGNFTKLLQDKLYWQSVANTFIYTFGKLIVTIPVALILAVILNQKIKGRQFLRAVFFMPTVISTAVISIVFFLIFNSYNGILNQFLVRTGIIQGNIDWLGTDYAMLTLIIVAIWGAVGNYMLLFIAGLQSIPQDVYESASIDGANAAQKLWFITIPMLGPVLQMIIMLAILISLKGYESIMLITEGGPAGRTEVMYLYVYKLFFPVSTGSAVNQQIGYGSAVGFTSALIVGIVTLIYFHISRRLNHS
ncbi:carbohydrate ABC transporter permease [Paenibacillus thalictri]|uniref:Sugar ABC transporter permease n=1 Tax=Paenibacillus thalictri TaxID=2527873 RepID=A0A4Q9E0I8_9BACL|nr:sugar ABC transporter permease [Paenibacillus thalictri]TBL81960.1 sugar ABC transporter permease [Paenibacillus thalictri]